MINLRSGKVETGEAARLAAGIATVIARLAFSLLIFNRPALAIHPDSSIYQGIANEIISGRAYAWDLHAPTELLRTVGYPAFLAGVYASLGRSPGDVALVQLALSGLLAVAAYLHLRSRVGLTPARIAALLLVVDPLTTYWSLLIVSETLSTVLLCIAVIIIARWGATQNWLSLLLAGFVLGLSCLVRPIGQLLAALLTLAIVLFPYAGTALTRQTVLARMKPALIFLAPVAVLIMPWVVRNAILWNCPTLSSVGRYTLRDWMAAEVISEYQRIPLAEAVRGLYATDPGMCPKQGAEYVAIIVAHPLIYAKLEAAGTIPVLFGTSFDRWFQLFGIDYQLPDLWRPYLDGGLPGMLRVLGAESVRFPPGLPLMGVLTAFQLLIYTLAILGVASIRQIGSPATRWTLIVVAAAALVLLLAPGPDGHERFRVPAQPLLVYLGAYGISRAKSAPIGRQESTPQAPSATISQ